MKTTPGSTRRSGEFEMHTVPTLVRMEPANGKRDLRTALTATRKLLSKPWSIVKDYKRYRLK
jgi:hypothetical protein